MKVSQYPDVNEVLSLLSTQLQEIFGDKLLALYLTGSLSYGDFDYGSSDIDFLAVLNKDLTANELSAIKNMHQEIAKQVPYWAKRLEGSYVPQEWLNNFTKPLKKRPYVNAGYVALLPYGDEWLLNLYVLYECGITLWGKTPQELIKAININDVRKASKQNLLNEWKAKLQEKDPFVHPKYDSSHLQAYAILTMCRILHRAKIDTVASKKKAAVWVKKTYPHWLSLIEEAENWQHGIKLDQQEQVKALIKFVLQEVTND